MTLKRNCCTRSLIVVLCRLFFVFSFSGFSVVIFVACWFYACGVLLHPGLIPRFARCDQKLLGRSETFKVHPHPLPGFLLLLDWRSGLCVFLTGVYGVFRVEPVMVRGHEVRDAFEGGDYASGRELSCLLPTKAITQQSGKRDNAGDVQAWLMRCLDKRQISQEAAFSPDLMMTTEDILNDQVDYDLEDALLSSPRSLCHF
ncbi:hypothetical protein BJV78DRAFT_1152982 [Lactifluus subvellereus]|nr:hypothetical protein BJV78DRAFT_1152982 [Lactifluus subvellereus]